jgi:hypothetical protein|uniref:Uncharacterized protein n=1 Tax=Kuenenia stuttgartiensis TaxID=174633 RepID=Q1PZ13_KUEST|nr:unknown protein [Candidatus Kuenenia stuttgartiensis]
MVILYNMNTILSPQFSICNLPTADCHGIIENPNPLQVPYGKGTELLQKMFVLYERLFSLK